MIQNEWVVTGWGCDELEGGGDGGDAGGDDAKEENAEGEDA